MTISLELSTIQHNAVESAVLNMHVQAFLSRGGVITASPLQKLVPLPYGRLKPIDKAAQLVRAKDKKEPGRNPRIHPQELIERIASMAETMSCPDIAKDLGLTYDQVKCIGNRHGFGFAKAENPGHASLPHKGIDAQIDLRDAERIKAHKGLGLSRRQTMQAMSMGTSRFYRLLETYDIDFPRLNPALNSVKRK